MKIIYHCYGGAHSSVTAAAIHLGKLTAEVVPHQKDFYNLDLFDRQTHKCHGNIIFVGSDENKNEIYILGRRNMTEVVENLARDLVQMLEINPKNIILVDASKHTNLLMRIGGIFSRRFGWVKLGRPIVIRGTIKAYPYLAALVQEVKAKVESRREKYNIC